MGSYQLYRDRYVWQRNTFDVIKSNLTSAKNDRFVRFDGSAENHLVMVYGASQIGKTTLILTMLGIKEDSIAKVSQTLRGGISKGNSSSSTATIYSRSKSGQYGCVLSSANEISSTEAKFFDDEEDMKKEIARIRERVETGMANLDEVLYIYIPECYFEENSVSDNISIMDMPGVGSRNHKEDNHVRDLMAKYIPISSVCIIACMSGQIQSLENLVLPNRIDWKEVSQRYVLAITYAYSADNIKSYFDSPQRSEKFFDHIKRTYTEKLHNILGFTNQTEVFPIDVGESFEKLCAALDPADREEVIDTRARVLAELAGFIKKHKGDRLKTALEELRALVYQYGKTRINEIDEDIQATTKAIENKAALIDASDKEYAIFAREKEKIEAKKQKRAAFFLKVSAHASERCVNSLLKEILSFIEENSLHKKTFLKKEDIVKDRKLMLFECCITKNVSDSADRYLKKFGELVKEGDIDYSYSFDAFDIKAKAIDIIKGHELRLLKQRAKIPFAEIENLCSDIQQKVNDLLSGYVAQYRDLYGAGFERINTEIAAYDLRLRQEKNKKYRYKSEISSYKQKFDELQVQRKNTEKTIREDDEMLKMYQDNARAEYIKQRNAIVMQINESESKYDKLLLVLYLGVLDNDYQRVTGGTNI